MTDQPNYEKLQIWQEGMSLSKEIYHLTKNFPKEEQFGITTQLRRAIVSVPLNIAEGHGRNSRLEFRRFLLIALGSLNESLTLLLLAKDLDLIKEPEYLQLRSRILIVMRQTRALITKIIQTPPTTDQAP